MADIYKKERVYKRNDRGLDGYMTLEAAMIFPAVFMLVIMILYVTFFLYDKCRMTQDLYTAAYRRSIERGKTQKEVKIDTSGYFMLNGCSADLSGGSEIRAKASGKMAPAQYAETEGGGRFWEITVTMSARKTDPPFAYRRFRRLAAIADQALSQSE